MYLSNSLELILERFVERICPLPSRFGVYFLLLLLVKKIALKNYSYVYLLKNDLILSQQVNYQMLVYVKDS